MEPIKVIKNEEYLAEAHTLLQEARRRVDICTYKFELSNRPGAAALNSLIEALYRLAYNGIEIRVLLNTTGKRTGLTAINLYAARALRKHGIEVRTLPDGRCQHSKMLLIDSIMGIIGSHNWSPKSMTDNYETAVVIRHAGCLYTTMEHFEKIWEGSKRI